MFIENTSKYDFTETAQRLNDAVLAGGWTLLAIHDLKETLHKKGFEVLPVRVFEVCKGSLSVKMLERDKERLFSSLMPCRVSVYETSQGVTKISRLNAAIMAKEFGGIVEEVMGDAFEQMEKILEPLIIKQ
ncbi:MAG: hypothetical protein A2X17_03935 [Bacteroidetes bacterium GWF2_41_61]|nr:MAG: hypothetical protein A2X20_09720 [Bacteroidetes bacterium GWE2_40_15]OFY31813.1 MAG: hypothetical protein A2X17_03935 [Bacteroidetes bacterium GWF2_41_61]OFY90391.1 MAG: hypothetical protein A2266_05745 [Bacteroidetes bacterium RIFOXYA12_FULL_40_10]HBG25038.1 hypothetical protein [Rikenellaceae bacterium]HBZ24872.1 hypothetical protein [Rikenellaceae bacterium]